MSTLANATARLQQEVMRVDNEPSSFIGDGLAIGQARAQVEMSLWARQTWQKPSATPPVPSENSDLSDVNFQSNE